MARLRNRVLHWGNKYDGPNTYKDGRRGALDDAYWDEYDLVDFPRKSKSNRPKKKRGCPANDYKAHVYVWVTETRYYSKWSDYMGLIQDKTRPYTVDVKKCCGCMKIAKRKYNW